MDIYVIRHGQTDFNKERRYNYGEDVDINDIGIKQSIEVSKVIKDLDIDLIISSPVKRTMHTTELINANNVPVICDQRLRERKEGKLAENCSEEFYKNEYYNYYSTEYVEGLETLPELFKRVHGFLDDVRKKYSGKNILLVTHGNVARVIQFYFEEMPKDRYAIKCKRTKKLRNKKICYVA